MRVQSLQATSKTREASSRDHFCLSCTLCSLSYSLSGNFQFGVVGWLIADRTPVLHSTSQPTQKRQTDTPPTQAEWQSIYIHLPSLMEILSRWLYICTFTVAHRSSSFKIVMCFITSVARCKMVMLVATWHFQLDAFTSNPNQVSVRPLQCTLQLQLSWANQ